MYSLGPRGNQYLCFVKRILFRIWLAEIPRRDTGGPRWTFFYFAFYETTATYYIFYQLETYSFLIKRVSERDAALC